MFLLPAPRGAPRKRSAGGRGNRDSVRGRARAESCSCAGHVARGIPVDVGLPALSKPLRDLGCPRASGGGGHGLRSRSLAPLHARRDRISALPGGVGSARIDVCLRFEMPEVPPPFSAAGSSALPWGGPLEH